MAYSRQRWQHQRFAGDMAAVATSAWQATAFVSPYRNGIVGGVA